VLLSTDRKPELEEPDAAADHHALELRSLAHELEIVVGCAETHDVLDPAAVVPGAVEENDFTLGGKVLDVALEMPPGRALAFFLLLFLPLFLGLLFGFNHLFVRCSFRFIGSDRLVRSLRMGGIEAAFCLLRFRDGGSFE
jgi:hypothetical protein